MQTAYTWDETEQTVSVSLCYRKLPVVPNENMMHIRCATWRVGQGALFLQTIFWV